MYITIECVSVRSVFTLGRMQCPSHMLKTDPKLMMKRMEIISRFILNLCGASQKRLDAKVLSAAEYSWLGLWMLSNKPSMIILHDNTLFYHLLILTHSAGLLVGESCLQWPPWMRCRCTSSSADGSVQKWSAVFIFVYSKAQGPTGEIKGKCSGCSLNLGSATFKT